MTTASSIPARARVSRSWAGRLAKSWPTVRGWLLFAILALVGLIMIYPYIWMVANSFKGPQGFIADPYSLIPKEISFKSIEYVWGSGNIAVYMKNSLVYALIIVTIQTFVDTLAAYAFARIQFPGSNILFIGVLATKKLGLTRSSVLTDGREMIVPP